MPRLFAMTLLLSSVASWSQAKPATTSGNVSLIGIGANGQPVAVSTAAANSVVSRSLSQHFSDTANVLDYGALGTGSTATIGTSYGSTLAAVAAYTSGGITPYAWMTNPNYGLTFSMATSSAQSAAGTLLCFTETLTSGYTATVALWDDPTHGNYVLVPGMQVTGTDVAAGTTLASADRTPGDANYGCVTLSASTTAAVAPATAITFALAPAQVQALTFDYLGIQSAIARANSIGSNSGSVFVPGTGT